MLLVDKAQGNERDKLLLFARASDKSEERAKTILRCAKAIIMLHTKTYKLRSTRTEVHLLRRRQLIRLL